VVWVLGTGGERKLRFRGGPVQKSHRENPHPKYRLRL